MNAPLRSSVRTSRLPLPGLAPLMAIAALAVVVSGQPAAAHGISGGGLGSGFLHPLLGSDHLLLLLGVGAAAASLSAQLLLWGLAGASGGWLAPLLRRSRIALMAFGGAWGLVFGAGMDVWQLAAFGPALTLPAFIAVHARAVPFDLVHALTNVILLGVAGFPLIALLDRSARRMRGRWLPLEKAE